MQALRDDPALRFEMCMGVSGVHYPHETGRELHAVYPLLSITHNRRVRLEVTCPDADPHIPSIVSVYPANDWHERETFDFFGIVFDGHPGLTRIVMPDDWPGHPQRKDYPLGGIPVEYKGAQIPPPDERRSYSMTDHAPTAHPTPTDAYAARETTEGTRLHRHRPGLGRRSPQASARPPTSGSSSTWARSTRPRTACSG